MKIKNYLPNFYDCMNINLTKDTWLWVQNYSSDKSDFVCELHHKNDIETLVENTQDIIGIDPNMSKKDIKRLTISSAMYVLPILYYKAIGNNDIELAKVYYETLTDIWFRTKQYIKDDLGTYMFKVAKGLPF